MIQVILRGGLGNQMFEYSLGLMLAKKYKTGLVLDTTYLHDRFPRKNITYRTYDLDIFGITPHVTALSKISRSAPVPGVWLGLDFALIGARDMLGLRKIARENDDLHFDPAVPESGGNVCLWGFWQSEKYFADARDEVRQAFTFRDELPHATAAMADAIRGTDSVSLSVRRGDYLRAGNSKIYGETDVKYYDEAARYVASRVPSPHFFVFSDDIAWCRENIRPPFPTTYIPDELRGPKWKYALELTSLCKHQIIANSTFWWWGAWLNRNPEKIVVAPREWHLGIVHDDVVPGEWVRL
jgi:Glycosyl transferase family 11